MTEEDKKLSLLITKWFATFERMKPGQAIEIGVTGKSNLKLFTDLCRTFIDGNPDFEFSNDMKYFKRFTA